MTRVLGPAFLVGIVLGTHFAAVFAGGACALAGELFRLGGYGYASRSVGRSAPDCRRAGHRPLPHHCNRLRRQSFGTLHCAVGYAARLGSI